MKIEKVATGNGEEVGEKQTIKRTNSRKNGKPNFTIYMKKSIENQASWKKRQTVMQNGSDTSVY